MKAFVLVFNRMTSVSLVESGQGDQTMQGAWWNGERRLDDVRGDLQLFYLVHSRLNGNHVSPNFFPLQILL